MSKATSQVMHYFPLSVIMLNIDPSSATSTILAYTSEVLLIQRLRLSAHLRGPSKGITLFSLIRRRSNIRDSFNDTALHVSCFAWKWCFPNT